MPCFITGSETGDLQLSRDEARREAQKVTRLLCLLCEWVEKDNGWWGPPDEVYDWWQEHKAIDAKETTGG